MADYLFIFRGGRLKDTGLSPDELQAYMQRWMAWVEDMKMADQWDGGSPLEYEGARVAGEHVDTDGPFAEAREVIGGYVVVHAADLKAACEIAGRCPIPEVGGSVEVRTIMTRSPFCTDV